MRSHPKVSYLLRFDDICPTMKWSNWDAIEYILLEQDIRPIMAVVPDNRDSDLYVESPNPDFWNRARRWQALGWAIGLHGFQHTYVTSHPGLFSRRKASEFAGLPPCAQRKKVESALAILRDEGLESNLWVAPGHSFDRNTVRIIRELGITTISDGFTICPYTDEHGILWIPQQLSEKQVLTAPRRRPVELKARGVWTVCFHANSWSKEDIRCFQSEIGRYRRLIRTADEVRMAYGGRQISWLDRIHAANFEVRRQFRLLVE